MLQGISGSEHHVGGGCGRRSGAVYFVGRGMANRTVMADADLYEVAQVGSGRWRDRAGGAWASGGGGI